MSLCTSDLLPTTNIRGLVKYRSASCETRPGSSATQPTTRTTHTGGCAHTTPKGERRGTPSQRRRFCMDFSLVRSHTRTAASAPRHRLYCPGNDSCPCRVCHVRACHARAGELCEKATSTAQAMTHGRPYESHGDQRGLVHEAALDLQDCAHSEREVRFEPAVKRQAPSHERRERR